MKYRSYQLSVTVLVVLMAAPDLLACGDKFMFAGRGTRYHRPKPARSASVLIYANPAAPIPAALLSARMQSTLKHQGHRSTTATTLEQLTTFLRAGQYDVVLAASDVAAGIEDLLGGALDAAVVVAFSAPPKEAQVLDAIDRAVARRDQNIRRNRTSS